MSLTKKGHESKCRGLAWPLLSEGAEAQKLGLLESWGAEGCELGLLGPRLGAWHWEGGGLGWEAPD